MREKKQHADEHSKDIVEFQKHTKRKKGFGKVKRPSVTPLNPKMAMELRQVHREGASNGAVAVRSPVKRASLGQSEVPEPRAKSSSIFEALNPLARKASRGKPPMKRKASTKGVNKSLPPPPTQL